MISTLTTPVDNTSEILLYLFHCKYLLNLCLLTDDIDEFLTTIDEIQVNLSLIKQSLFPPDELQ